MPYVKSRRLADLKQAYKNNEPMTAAEKGKLKKHLVIKQKQKEKMKEYGRKFQQHAFFKITQNTSLGAEDPNAYEWYFWNNFMKEQRTLLIDEDGNMLKTTKTFAENKPPVSKSEIFFRMLKLANGHINEWREKIRNEVREDYLINMIVNLLPSIIIPPSKTSMGFGKPTINWEIVEGFYKTLTLKSPRKSDQNMKRFKDMVKSALSNNKQLDFDFEKIDFEGKK